MRKTLSITFFVLVLALGGLVFFVVKEKSRDTQTGEPVSRATDGTTVSLPILTTQSVVTGTLIHYFLSGTVAQTKTNAEGTQVILAEDDGTLPVILITPTTRVSRISPPYSAATSRIVSVKTLKQYTVVDISLEYDLRTTQWIVRDLFIPTDRN